MIQQSSAYVQNDVGIAVVELSIEILLPRLDLEFLQINTKQAASLTERNNRLVLQKLLLWQEISCLLSYYFRLFVI